MLKKKPRHHSASFGTAECHPCGRHLGVPDALAGVGGHAAHTGRIPAWGSLRTLGMIWFLGVSCQSQGWVGTRPESLIRRANPGISDPLECSSLILTKSPSMDEVH